MPRQLKWTNPDELQKRIDEYFSLCDSTRKELQLKNGDIRIRYEKPPTIAGLAYFLGCNKDTLYSWMNEECKVSIGKDIQKQISDCLADARDRIEALTLERASQCDYEPKIATLILNGFGYNSRDDSSSIVLVKVAGADGKDVNDWSK